MTLEELRALVDGLGQPGTAAALVLVLWYRAGQLVGVVQALVDRAGAVETKLDTLIALGERTERRETLFVAPHRDPSNGSGHA